MEGKTLAEVVPTKERLAILERAYRSALAGKAATIEVAAGDGGDRTFLVKAFPVREDDGRIEYGMVLTQDVTERRQIDDRLKQTQKMEAIGLLAGSVAHDFNNLLTVILSYSNMLRPALEGNAEALSDLSELRSAAARAADLTRQLLTVSRRQSVEPTLLDPNAVISEIDRMFARLLGENIRRSIVPAPDLWKSRVDAGQLGQLMLNLAVNARDAMPDGGTLTIETKNVVIDASAAAMHPDVKPGDFVMIAVSDTGTGIPENVRLRLFEPFFTTKAKGRGTGLGLATCYGIAKQAGGHIWVYSEVGRGTTFKVYLPRALADGEKATAAARVPEPDPVRAKEATVLVVDDEQAIRTLMVRTLRRAGYVVMHAGDGVRAIDLLKSVGPRVDLVVTDVVMPAAGGEEIAAFLESSRSSARLLLLSGYTENMIGRKAGGGFLEKPFTPDALLAKVRAMLAPAA
jgi:two-component system cell cycle sensor histidine kinase/response regulator CckA